MADFKPLRLKRTLKPIIGDQWAFSMTISGLAEADDTITSIVISRGTSGRNVGHNPTTCEVEFIGRQAGTYTGFPFRVFIRENPANLIAALIGTSGALIAERFRGRLGVISILDNGDKKPAFTTFSGSSYLTQMNYSPAGFTPYTNETLATLLNDMTKANEPIRGVNFNTSLEPTNLRYYGDGSGFGESGLFNEGKDWAAADIGILIQDRRDGSATAWSHQRRVTHAANRAETEFPLMRNQAISPATYEQPNERPAKIINYQIRNEQGGLATRTAELANVTGENREVEEIDWSKWQVLDFDNQLKHEAYARVFESSARIYSIPTVRVDLLMLLRDGGQYALRIARQMLELEVGDPVFLSGDWPNALRGTHFADGIKETLKPDEWSIELSLVPHVSVTGQAPPTVRPRAWDSFTYDWQTETKQWNEA